ncbi:MAG: hypothetical protein SH857_15955 [Chitinophagales bacterium]|mgnify:CR=1 FL=1|nr:hypothetical protein [Chitinophagales bacterium]
MKTIKIFLILFLSSFILVTNSCKKDDDCNLVCQNGGTLKSPCGCDCLTGFTGTQCETDNRPACQQNNTGTVDFDSYSDNPYSCYINNVYAGQVGSYGNKLVTSTAGFKNLRVLQVNGYVLYPSEFTGTATLSQCGILTFKFP